MFPRFHPDRLIIPFVKRFWLLPLKAVGVNTACLTHNFPFPAHKYPLVMGERICPVLITPERKSKLVSAGPEVQVPSRDGAALPISFQKQTFPD